MQRTMVRRVGALVLGLALFGAACGDDDDAGTSETTVAPAAETTAAAADTTAAGAETTAAGADTTTGGGSETPTAVTCDGVKLAFFGALTGDAANLGINIKNGAALAIDQFNEANPDCQVELVELDSQGSPDRAPDLALQAINDDGVLGIIGPAFSGESAAAGPAFAEAGLATITPSATNPPLAENGWPTFNRILGNDFVQGPGDAVYIRDTVGAQAVFVVDDQSEYGKGLGDIVRDELGDTVVGSDTVQQGQTDFASTVSAVTGASADAVFYGGYYAEAGLFLKQLREGGYEGAFVAGDGVKDVGFVEAAGAANAEGAVVTCTCAPPESAPEFAEAYEAVYGGPPQTYGAEAYDSANIFLAGLADGVTDREGMVEFARGFTGPGVTKEIAFDENGEVTSTDTFAYEVLGGEIVTVGLIE